MTETVSITPENAADTPFPPVRRCPVAAPEEYERLREEGPLVKVNTIGDAIGALKDISSGKTADLPKCTTKG